MRMKKREATKMTEGYRAMAKDQKQFAAMASQVVHEVLPEWK